ncbi:conserved hypothetical protein [Methylocella tundrae]|uniref:Uncharacterized protein n=1 Tax=Methylocella tundrae TaxID=227605 RepID=A0A8B6M5F9_METTU|nr:hypothetical protein [Methylocella tundrae]VTZ50237.1 conserved hypothetical protein [Methylocella tundrae]
MSYLIFGLGLLLAVCGAASISFGYGIINVERGWSSVIAGAAALSGGIVTMALATILHSLARLRAFLKAERDARAKAAEAPWQAELRVTEAAGAQASVAPWQEAALQDAAFASLAGIGAEPEIPPPEPGPTPSVPNQRVEAAASPVAQASIEDIRRVVAETIKSKPQTSRHEEGDAFAGRSQARAEPSYAAPAQQAEPPVEQVQRRRAPPLSFGLPRALGLKEIPQPFDAAQAPAARSEAETGSEDNSSLALERGRREAEAALNPATPHPPASPAESAAETRSDPAQERRAVIGRYESEGTTYVMFADGSIEARSERGAFHFTSMAELKVFMDSQARGE